MAIKVGINGFGRIGRLVFRAVCEQPEHRDCWHQRSCSSTPDYMCIYAQIRHHAWPVTTATVKATRELQAHRKRQRDRVNASQRKIRLRFRGASVARSTL